MKISNLEGVKEIRIATVLGRDSVGIYESVRFKDGVLMIYIDIDKEAAAYTCTRPNLEADERKAAAEF